VTRRGLDSADTTAGTLRILDSADALSVIDWDTLAGPHDFFLSTRWLRVVEATAGVPVRYLIEEDCGTVAGGLATALADRTVPWLSGRPDTLLDRCVREELPGAAELRRTLPADLGATLLPAMICGGRHLGRTRILTREDRADEDADRIDRLLAAAERLGREEGARCLAFLYVDERDRALRAVLHRRGYASHRSGSYSWLPVPAGGLEAHLGAVSAHRARRIRAERRELRAAGVRCAIEPLTADLIPRLAELETALLTKYGLSWSAAQSVAILEQVLAVFGSEALVSLALLDGAVVGFGLLLRHRDHWYAHRAGFDYAAQGSLPLYFDVLYYQPIESAPVAGISTIHYGTGSVAAKRSRGCSTVDQYAYVRLLPAVDP
jgi:uncharacterized protein